MGLQKICTQFGKSHYDTLATKMPEQIVEPQILLCTPFFGVLVEVSTPKGPSTHSFPSLQLQLGGLKPPKMDPCGFPGCQELVSSATAPAALLRVREAGTLTHSGAGESTPRQKPSRTALTSWALQTFSGNLYWKCRVERTRGQL